MKRLFIEIEMRDDGKTPNMNISVEGKNYEVCTFFAVAGAEIAKITDLTLEQLLEFLTRFYGITQNVSWDQWTWE